MKYGDLGLGEIKNQRKFGRYIRNYFCVAIENGKIQQRSGIQKPVVHRLLMQLLEDMSMECFRGID